MKVSQWSSLSAVSPASGSGPEAMDDGVAVAALDSPEGDEAVSTWTTSTPLLLDSGTPVLDHSGLITIVKVNCRLPF